MQGRQAILSQSIPCGNGLATAGETLQIVDKLTKDHLLGLVLSKTPDQRVFYEIEGMINAPQGIFLSLRTNSLAPSEEPTYPVWILKIVGGSALMVPSDEEFAAVSQLSRPAPVKPLLESLIGFFPA